MQNGRSARTGRVGGVVGPMEPLTWGRVIRERAVSEWGCVARSRVVQAERNWITREWARARAEGAVVAQGGSGPRMLFSMQPRRGSGRWREANATGSCVALKQASVGKWDRHRCGGLVLLEAQARPELYAKATFR